MEAATKAAGRNRFTRAHRLFSWTIFAALLLAALIVASGARAAIEPPPPPQVWSDKGDYAPGEEVSLAGANWAPGEAVHIRVNDDAGETWRRDVDVTAADDGTLSDSFNLPNWFVAVYSVTATGASSGAATWTFTDSSPAAAAISIRQSDCSTASTSFVNGNTVCMHSTVTVSSTGNQSYRVQWFSPTAGSTPTFEDTHALSVAGTTTFDDSHAVTANGTWTVKACGSAACNGSNFLNTPGQTFTVVADTVAPDTAISASPSNPSSSSAASFSFTASDAAPSSRGPAFECSLDGAAFAACASPKSYSGLAEGSHSFRVRATDAAGNTDATPASFGWAIDTVAPDTAISASPSNPSSSSAASFSFTASDAAPSSGGLAFECSLDGAAFAACTSPKSYSGLAEGSHSFRVRATDAAGNTDATPASFGWAIDTVAPDTAISASPSN